MMIPTDHQTAGFISSLSTLESEAQVAMPTNSVPSEAPRPDAELVYYAKLAYYTKHGILCFMLATAAFGFYYITESTKHTRPTTRFDLYAREIGYLGLSIISFWRDHTESLIEMCISVCKTLLVHKDTICFIVCVFVVYRM